MKKVLYILFHRSVLVALSLLAQVVTLVVMVNIFFRVYQQLLLVLHRHQRDCRSADPGQPHRARL